MTKKFLERLSEFIRTKQYSYSTDKSYVYWARQFILFHNKRHPEEMGAKEIDGTIVIWNGDEIKGMFAFTGKGHRFQLKLLLETGGRGEVKGRYIASSSNKQYNHYD